MIIMITIRVNDSNGKRGNDSKYDKITMMMIMIIGQLIKTLLLFYHFRLHESLKELDELFRFKG